MTLKNSSVINVTQKEFCDYTEDEYLCLANKLISGMGPMWECLGDDESLFKAIYEAFSSCIYDLNQYMCNAAKQANPCTADCFVEEWLTIFSALDCLEDDKKTLDTVCKIYNGRGIFDCDFVKCLAELSDHVVLECVELCNNCEPCCVGDTFGNLMMQKQCFTEVVTYPDCATRKFDGNLFMGSPPGTSYFTYDPKCDFEFANNPCQNCCPEEVIEIPTLEFDPCSPPKLQPCDCDDPVTHGCNVFIDVKPVITQYPSYNPASTIVIKLQGPNPCTLDSDTFGDLFVENDFKICLIERLKPAFVKIRYEFEC